MRFDASIEFNDIAAWKNCESFENLKNLMFEDNFWK